MTRPEASGRVGCFGGAVKLESFAANLALAAGITAMAVALVVVITVDGSPAVCEAAEPIGTDVHVDWIEGDYALARVQLAIDWADFGACRRTAELEVTVQIDRDGALHVERAASGPRPDACFVRVLEAIRVAPPADPVSANISITPRLRR
jgi:hypothetical protein